MEKKPIFSIVIPTYNRAHLIEKAVGSVQNQTYNDWELIIVDDCSTDNIDEVIREYRDERIKFFKLAINKGNAGARNEGVKQSKGKYVFFLDSDDEMHPEALGCFRKKYNKSSKIDFAFGGYKTKNQDTGVTANIFWKPKKDVPFIRELKIGTGCGLFVRRDIFNHVGLFDEQLRVAVDTDWLIRLDNCGYKPTLLEDILVTVNIHDGNRVRDNKKELLKTYEIIVNKNFDEINSDKNLYCKFYYKLMWLNFYDKNYCRGNKIFNQLIGRNALSVRIIGILVIFNIFPLNIAKKIHKGLLK